MSSSAARPCSCTSARRSSTVSSGGSGASGGSSARDSASLRRSSSAGIVAGRRRCGLVELRDSARRLRSRRTSAAMPMETSSQVRRLRIGADGTARRERTPRCCYHPAASCLASARPFPVVSEAARPTRPKEGDTGTCDRVRDSAAARPGPGGGSPGRGRHAHPRAGREGRRLMGRARRLGSAQARLRDRPQGRGRLPPAAVHLRGRDAGRDLARAPNRRRRPAPHGDTSDRGESRAAGSGGRADARGCRDRIPSRRASRRAGRRTSRRASRVDEPIEEEEE